MKYVIIGASAAGVNAAKTLRELDNSSEITVISKDTNVYSRCMLHHVIGGRRNLEKISFVDKDFFSKYRVTWIKNKSIIDINIDKRELVLEDNSAEKYDKLLIASGASSFIPPVKNLREAKRVYSLRDYDDVLNIEEGIKVSKKAVILGAGLVGIDAAIGLMERDISLSIVEMGDRILPLQLDKKAANRYQKLLKDKNIEIYTSVKLEEVILKEGGFVDKVKLSDGTEIECDMIVVAAGVRPNVGFIKNESIKIERGIVVDNTCSTSAKDVYAAGDVTFTAPIWPIAVKQGIVAAYNMTGHKKYLEDTFALRNSMNFLGLECVSLGIVEAPDNSYVVDIIETEDVYKKIIHKDGIVYGAILVGDISYCGVLQYIVKNKIDISNINKNIFKIDYSDFFSIKEDGQFKYKAL
ncbi:nitrate reductase subunit beta [Clostridium polyendosporum]|uniref:Nitrate reductase subunit beta n=1 Tax=Clostridium polyendosporum TaxID=69208 RepID=A0A919VGG8_9CLOT|nr:FAD-dependent oxidoreductase [Clostridium polyendosporum]GIM29177.1 nitrate reductase subunit beta [Clostridium polyendosporum]